MIASPDPLGERLTLMWHDHFATSNEKVNNLAAMRRQNETFRRLARAPFGELLNATARDPALLVWLDASDNRPGRPNENLARELLELFTLGVGHYTEADVKESARALTGWTVKSGRFREIRRSSGSRDEDDPGTNGSLGRSGPPQDRPRASGGGEAAGVAPLWPVNGGRRGRSKRIGISGATRSVSRS